MTSTAPSRRKRRLWSLTAVLGVGSLALSACGGGGDDGGGDAAAAEVAMDEQVGAMEDYSAGDTFKATEPVEFSLLYRNHPNYPNQDDWDFYQQLEKKHNVTLETKNAPLSDWEERRSLVIGAGDAPDFIPIVYPGDETQFISGGALLPVSEYLEHMPHLTEKIEEWELQDDFDSLYKGDGKFYILPGIHESVQPQYSIAVRGDIWDEMGYEDPETWEQFAEQLAGVEEKYPEMVPYSDRWEMKATLNVAAPSFGTIAGWGYGDGMYYDADADEFVYAGASDGYRQLLEYFNGLVEDDLMDPESFTQDDEQAIQKFASGKSAAIGANDQELLKYRETIEQVGDEDMSVRMITVPAGPAGDRVSGSRLESGMALSSDVAEKDHFVALLQFLDWLYYSDEGLEFAKWGVEGETYTKKDGERVLAEDITIQGMNPDAEKALNTDYGYHNGVYMLAHGSTTDLAQSMLRDEVVAFRDAMGEKELVPPAPPRPLDEMQREQAGLTQTALGDSVDVATSEFILGERDIDEEWDDYVAELEAQGLEKYVSMQNEAYQTAKESIEGIEADLP